MYRRKRHRRTYRKNTRRTLRKTNTLLREILLFLQSLLRQPFVKTVLLIFVTLPSCWFPCPGLSQRSRLLQIPVISGKAARLHPLHWPRSRKKSPYGAQHPTKPKPWTSRTTSRASSPAKCLRPFPWKLSKLSQWPPGLIPWENPEIPNRRQSQITPQGSCLRLHPLPGLPESF